MFLNWQEVTFFLVLMCVFNTVFLVLQAYVLKYILFFPNELGKVPPGMTQNLGARRLSESQCVASNNFPSLNEDAKAR